MTPEYIKLKLQIKRKMKIVAKHQMLLQDLKSQCPHEEVVAKESYVSGGYLNTGETSYWNECTLCGKRSEITRKSDGMFG